MKDPAIEEIRKVRQKISEQFPDIKSFIKHYQELEKKYSDRFTFLGKPKPQQEQHKT
jgi:inorganic pyrophosphatase